LKAQSSSRSKLLQTNRCRSLPAMKRSQSPEVIDWLILT